MMRVRRVGMAMVAAAVVAAGCTAITIPTFPPFPSMPPFELPSGFEQSIPPGADTCTIVSAAEVSSVFGDTFSDQSSKPTECSFLSNRLPFPIVVTVADGQIIDGIKLVAQGEEMTIGGNRALFASLIGDGVYVEKGGRSLTVQAVAQGGLRDELIALANIAVSRF